MSRPPYPPNLTGDPALPDRADPEEFLEAEKKRPAKGPKPSLPGPREMPDVEPDKGNGQR